MGEEKKKNYSTGHEICLPHVSGFPINPFQQESTLVPRIILESNHLRVLLLDTTIDWKLSRTKELISKGFDACCRSENRSSEMHNMPFMMSYQFF